jgi:hypothetical protein
MTGRLATMKITIWAGVLAAAWQRSQPGSVAAEPGSAARLGDFEALIAVLDPDVVLRSDRGALPGSAVVRGAEAVAAQALMFADPSRLTRAALVNGAAGVVVTVDERPVSVMGFTVAEGKIVAIDALIDPERLGRLDLTALDD